MVLSWITIFLSGALSSLICRALDAANLPRPHGRVSDIFLLRGHRIRERPLASSTWRTPVDADRLRVMSYLACVREDLDAGYESWAPVSLRDKRSRSAKNGTLLIGLERLEVIASVRNCTWSTHRGSDNHADALQVVICLASISTFHNSVQRGKAGEERLPYLLLLALPSPFAGSALLCSCLDALFDHGAAESRADRNCGRQHANTASRLTATIPSSRCRSPSVTSNSFLLQLM